MEKDLWPPADGDLNSDGTSAFLDWTPSTPDAARGVRRPARRRRAGPLRPGLRRRLHGHAGRHLERRHRPARRGRRRQDHRRRGLVVAHRPDRLRRQRAGRRGGLRQREGDRRGEGREATWSRPSRRSSTRSRRCSRSTARSRTASRPTTRSPTRSATSSPTGSTPSPSRCRSSPRPCWARTVPRCADERRAAAPVPAGPPGSRRGGRCRSRARRRPAARPSRRRSRTRAPRAPPRATRSSARTRPASRPRRRTGCTSPPSTWPPMRSADDLRELLADWTYAASRMTQGLEVTEGGAVGGSPLAPPADTGEALGLPPSGLTITFGFGPTLFRMPTAPTASASPPARPRPWRRSPASAATPSTRSRAAETCASRPAPTIRRWRCTRSAT